MGTENYCQSCSMPLDDETLRGTEKDGSRSAEYCTYCYRDGKFVNPAMTLKEMSSLVVSKMEEMHIDSKTIDLAVMSLPELKRWKQK